jgi:competence ComEA-like helix-hairpin-helix protein
VPTQSERKALMFIAAAALLGAAVRVMGSFSGQPAPSDHSRRALENQIAAVQAARKTPEKRTTTSSAKITKVVDVDIATVAQLQTLPRVGPVLAQRIKAFRDSAGPFGSLEQLDKVKGIGPALLKELAPRVTFSSRQSP